MKIIALHGDNAIKVYERLQRFMDVAKKRGMLITRLDNNSNFIDAFSSQSLFKEKILYVVSDVLLLTNNVLAWINGVGSKHDHTLVITHVGTLRKSLLNTLPKDTKVEEYKLPVYVWKFLDSFYPGNAKVALAVFNDASKQDAPEFLFAMLARHLRDIYLLKLNEDTPAIQPWKATKLKNQLRYFANGDLERIIELLAKADIKTKTSKSTIKSELDFIIASQLE